MVGVGDSRLSRAGSRRFAGSASPGRGKPLSRKARRVTRVEVAVQRVRGKRCSWLASASGKRFKPGSCTSGRTWVRAAGTRAWQLELGQALPPGRYVAYSRATIAAGFREGSFTAADRNRVAFRVG